ncbi:hypothetical protein QA332_08860 [Glaesserella parasuis]|uniref:hypothetical protein n=1 Tax=Glaesserella parasuis TaxID=738 RepID=UPI0005C69E2E|nr:hypothetical protein [Glaesserella parasuis]MDG4923955.1 hypothetical protein [Glaesserella parasuis]MDG6253482.1 hypothetical protein [Glaesserella parasuis]MDG6255541.1 hypothetical protein [Glaesserella parasuis]MDG6262028.1 hypothetical protein [Glaesserella parasuis]MDG6304056.1 hypothetical protein [Glaesserella parasuis]
MNNTIERLEKSIRFLEGYKSTLDENTSTYYRIGIILPILSKIKLSEDDWSKQCQYLYPKYREELFKELIYLEGERLEDDISILIEGIYCRCAYLLREYILYMESNAPYEYRFGMDDLSVVHNKILNDNYDFIDKKNEDRLNVIKDKQLDIWILGYYFYGKSFKSFEKYEELVKESEGKSLDIKNKIDREKDKLSDFIKEKQEKVQQLAKQLEEQKTAFNFVGLSQGFEKLLNTKKSARSYTFFFLVCIGAFLFVVPAAYIQTIMSFSVDTINDPYIWKLAIPFTGAEIILLYFFRVILNHYNSLQTQIMQLELRQSLCQFIQSYADYAKEIKEKDGASLEKFENLIFSSILSSPDKVPSTFDGLEQLSNLIKNMRSGS